MHTHWPASTKPHFFQDTASLGVIITFRTFLKVFHELCHICEITKPVVIHHAFISYNYVVNRTICQLNINVCKPVWSKTLYITLPSLLLGLTMSWFSDLAGKAEDFLNKVDQGAASALSKNQSSTSSFATSYEGEATVEPAYNTTRFKTETAVKQHVYASSHDAQSYISAAAGNIKQSNASLQSAAASAVSNPPSAGSIPASAKASSAFVRPKKSDQDVDDDMLFDFLNSSDPPVSSSRRDSRRDLVKAVVPVTEAQHSTPPPSAIPQTIPSVPSTPPSTRGVSRASSMSSLSGHSIKTSEDGSAKRQSQGMINDRVVVQLYSI